jgi:hypothetical protein
MSDVTNYCARCEELAKALEEAKGKNATLCVRYSSLLASWTEAVVKIGQFFDKTEKQGELLRLEILKIVVEVAAMDEEATG